MKRPITRTTAPIDSTEAELLSRARAGDHDAFRRLVRRLENVVYRYAFKVCRDRDKAEEAFQDTFINMYRKLDQFDGRSRLSTWLYRVVTNHCLMKYRKEKTRGIAVPLDEHVLGGEGRPLSGRDRSPLDHVLQLEMRSALDGAIRSLPMAHRLVFVLRDLEGQTAAETAKVLNISVEAVKSRLRRARAALRKSLDHLVTP